MPPLRARIALLTDFGTRDPYVAAMKGVLVSRCDAPVLDASHEVEPFDVFEAALFLEAIFRFWPPGTVFVVVVDPGVGSERRIVAAEQDGRFLIAPDNGVLMLVLRDDARVVTVENQSHFLEDGSRTFHGRDRFAPTAAELANSLPLETLGPPVDVDRLVKLPYTRPSYADGVAFGTIVRIDRFGNAITDLDASRIRGSVALRVGQALIARRAQTYEEMRGSSEPFLIAGSGGTLEISVSNGSAARLLHLARFDRVEWIRTA